MRRLVLVVAVVVGMGVLAFRPPSVRADEPTPTLTLDQYEAPVGTTLTLDGAGFDAWVNAAHGVTIAAFDADGHLYDSGEVAVNEDGTLETTITTDNYAPGAYTLRAFYTFWGVRHDPITNDVVCDFCPVQTVPLTDPINLTLTAE
jgi:hypothetical protein